MNYEKLKAELNELAGIVDWYKNSDKNAKRCAQVIDALKSRVDLSKKEFIQIVDINHEVVTRRLLKYCAYLGNRYIGRVYLDDYGNAFGTVQEVTEKYGADVVFCCHSHNDCYRGAYSECKYMPEMEAVLMATITANYYTNIMAIDDNNSHISKAKCAPTYKIITKDMMVFGSGRPAHISNAYFYEEDKAVGLMESVKQMLGLEVGVVNVGGNKYVTLDSIANIKEFVAYKAKLAYKSGKIQNKIDELVAKKEFNTIPLVDRMPHEYNQLVCKTNINKIEDNLCVVRWTYSYKDECFDGMRVYIDGKDVYACKRNNNNQFVRVALSTLNQKHFASEYESELVMDDMTGTRLEWYTSIIHSIPTKHRMTLLMMFLTDVKLEQLVKLGFADAICKSLEDSTGNIGAVIRSALKVNNSEEESKNIYRWLGINKYQLSKVVELCAKTPSDMRNDSNDKLIRAIADIKTMFGRDDISAFDNKLFDRMFDAYSIYFVGSCEKNTWTYAQPYNVYLILSDVANMDVTGVTVQNMIHYMPTLLEMSKWNRHAVDQYRDFIKMVNAMGIRQQVKLYPATLEDLKRMHDDAVVVFNLNKNKYKRDAFIARTEGWKKMEYENEDFEFVVVAPEKPEDLAVEGLELRHCVKSYIDRVANGQTNVLFIRRKDDAAKPFFTVEVSNDRTIRQVHGFANRNASTEPNMVEFVHRWARNKRLRIGNFDSVRG